MKTTLIVLLISVFSINSNPISEKRCKAGYEEIPLLYFNAQGNAVATNDKLQIASNGEKESGLIYKFPIHITDDFSVILNSELTPSTTDWDVIDGIAVNFHNDQRTKVVGYGGNIGNAELSNSLTHELDLWKNTEPGVNDLSDKTLSIHDCLTSACSPNENETTSQVNLPSFKYDKTKLQPFYLEAKYFNGLSSFHFNDFTEFSQKKVDISTLKDQAFVSFTTFYRGQNRQLNIKSAYLCKRIPIDLEKSVCSPGNYSVTFLSSSSKVSVFQCALYDINGNRILLEDYGTLIRSGGLNISHEKAGVKINLTYEIELSYSGEYETITITYDSSTIQTQAVRFDQESKSLGLITEVK